MKHLLAVTALLTACTAVPVSRTAGIVITAHPRNCIDPSASGDRIVRITNATTADISFSVSTESPPYQLHAHTSNLLYESPLHEEPIVFGVDLTDYVERPLKITLAPGQSQIFRSISHGWPSTTDDHTYYWEIKDSSWRSHRSDPIKLCR